MWFAIFAVLFVVAALALAPKPQIENARSAKLGDFQFPRAGYGDLVPLFWGTVRLKSPVVIWFGDFQAVPIVKTIDGGWFSSDKHQTVGYKNYLGINVLLSIGPGVTLKRFWAGTKLVWTGSQSTVGNITIDQPNLFGGEEQQGGLQGVMTFYPGDTNQTQDSYLAGILGTDVPKYNGFSHIVFRHFYIGTTATPEAFSFEVSKLTSGLSASYSIMPNGLDLNPMEVVYDALTGSNGKFNLPVSSLDLTNLTSVAQTLYNEGLGMSFAVQNAISGKDLLEEIMRHCDGILYKDPATAKIKCKLIRQDYNIATLQTLGDSDVIEITSFDKTLWADTYNQSRVKFSDRATDYEDSVAIAQDFGNINFQQRVRSNDISMPTCKTADIANKLAAKQLAIVSVPLYKCDLICKRTAQNLRPGDVFILQHTPYGIASMVMRVSKIDFGTLEDGKIRITCIQDKYASDETTMLAPPSSGWTPINTDAQPVTVRQIVPAPFFLARSEASPEAPGAMASQGRMMLMAKSPTSSSISFDVRKSIDAFASTNDFEGNDIPYFITGQLNAAYAATVGLSTGQDTSGAFVVKGLSSGDVSRLHNFSFAQGALNGSGLILVNSELMIYAGFTDNGDGTVTFSNIYRSLLDTRFASHSMNDRVWFLDGKTCVMPTLYANSATPTFRLLDNTTRDSLAFADAANIGTTYNGRTGKPYHPQYLTLQGSRTPGAGTGLASVAVAWRRRNRGATSIAAYNAADDAEAGVDTKLQWRVGSGGYTTTYETGSSATLNVTGLTGTLEVIVSARITATGVESTSFDTLTMTLS